MWYTLISQMALNIDDMPTCQHVNMSTCQHVNISIFQSFELMVRISEIEKTFKFVCLVWSWNHLAWNSIHLQKIFQSLHQDNWRTPIGTIISKSLKCWKDRCLISPDLQPQISLKFQIIAYTMIAKKKLAFAKVIYFTLKCFWNYPTDSSLVVRKRFPIFQEIRRKSHFRVIKISDWFVTGYVRDANGKMIAYCQYTKHQLCWFGEIKQGQPISRDLTSIEKICDMKSNIWYMIYDIWYMIYDIWEMIYDMWYMIYDIWYLRDDIW
jgi:hypothetical protein